MGSLPVQPDVLFTIVAVFVTVALLSGTVGAFTLRQLAPERRRLRSLVSDKPRAVSESPILAGAGPTRLKPFAVLVPKSPKEMSRLRRRLARAGYYQPSAPLAYSLLELGMPVLFGGLTLAVLGLSRGPLLALFAAVVGYMLPGLVLLRQIEKRKKELTNGLPDALDLFVVCLEAGCALDQAILKASEELEIAYPALAQELKILMAETRAGKPRLEAFRNLAERTKVEDVRSLVAMLIQTDRFGTSVALALKTHADVARTKRRQRAEERAAKVSVKLVFPLVLCLFPAFYVVTLGPAVIQFVRKFPRMGP
jgi:tight adherence protein C